MFLRHLSALVGFELLSQVICGSANGDVLPQDEIKQCVSTTCRRIFVLASDCWWWKERDVRK